MEFRRSGQRRRRVMMDEMRAPSPSGADQGRRETRSASYAAAARAADQPVITSLIPKRLWSLTVLLLLGVLGVAAIQALYVEVYCALPSSVRASLIGLDVEARGSLAGWYNGVLLLLSAAVSTMIFHLRRHKVDDYKGRYRLWAWGTLVLLAASIDAVTGLHAGAASALTGVTGTPIWGDGQVWWMLSVGVVFLLVGVRALIETRRSLATVCVGLLALITYGIAAAFQLQLWRLEYGLLSAMVSSTALMSANLLLSFALLVYCRFVYWEAQEKPTQTASTAVVTPSSPAEQQPAAATDPPRVKRRPAIRVDKAHKPSPAAASQPAEAPSPDGDDAAAQKMSKAERRRLRKQQRRQKRDADKAA